MSDPILDMREPITVHVLCERLDVIDGCRRQNPVAEIKNVPRPSLRPIEHVFGSRQHAIERPKEKGGIEIALNRAVVADAIPRVVQVNAPVCADDVATRLAQVVKDVRRAGPEMDRRHAHTAIASKILRVCGRTNSR